MKTLMMTLCLAGCMMAAKAQQIKTIPQARMMPDKKVPQWKRSFNDSLSLNKAKSSTYSYTISARTTKRTMPIATPPNTDRKMPIAKTDRTGYNMPIAGKTDTTIKKMQLAPTTTYDKGLTPPPPKQ